MATYTISETTMKSILMTMTRRKEQLAKEWWKQDNNEELEEIDWDAMKLCDNRELKEYWIENNKEGDKWRAKQFKAEGTINGKVIFISETYEDYKDHFVNSLTAEDDYREHLAMEDPNNVNIEQPYTMRKDDEETKKKYSFKKKSISSLNDADIAYLAKRPSATIFKKNNISSFKQGVTARKWCKLCYDWHEVENKCIEVSKGHFRNDPR